MANSFNSTSAAAPATPGPISSTSTFAEVEAAYDDNASYAEEASPTKARAFITAATILLRRMPEASGTREANFQYRMDLIEKQIQQARDWLAANDNSSSSANTRGPGVKRLDFRNSRD
jgi:hypothetical protein